jgi:hypothetical protein
MNVATQRSGTDLAPPTKRFSEYTGPEKDERERERERKINPLLGNVYKQNGYFSGN